jgi:predicted RNase H-like HicB family nuclease
MRNGANAIRKHYEHASLTVSGIMAQHFTAAIRQHEDWWIGWVTEILGVNSQGVTRAELLENLTDALQEALEMNRADARAAAAGPYEEVSISL